MFRPRGSKTYTTREKAQIAAGILQKNTPCRSAGQLVQLQQELAQEYLGLDKAGETEPLHELFDAGIDKLLFSAFTHRDQPEEARRAVLQLLALLVQNVRTPANRVLFLASISVAQTAAAAAQRPGLADLAATILQTLADRLSPEATESVPIAVLDVVMNVGGKPEAGAQARRAALFYSLRYLETCPESTLKDSGRAHALALTSFWAVSAVRAAVEFSGLRAAERTCPATEAAQKRVSALRRDIEDAIELLAGFHRSETRAVALDRAQQLLVSPVAVASLSALVDTGAQEAVKDMLGEKALKNIAGGKTEADTEATITGLDPLRIRAISAVPADYSLCAGSVNVCAEVALLILNELVMQLGPAVFGSGPVISYAGATVDCAQLAPRPSARVLGQEDDQVLRGHQMPPWGTSSITAYLLDVYPGVRRDPEALREWVRLLGAIRDVDRAQGGEETAEKADDVNKADNETEQNDKTQAKNETISETERAESTERAKIDEIDDETATDLIRAIGTRVCDVSFTEAVLRLAPRTPATAAAIAAQRELLSRVDAGGALAGVLGVLAGW